MSKITHSIVCTLCLIFLVSVIIPQFANGQEDVPKIKEKQKEALDHSNQHRKWTGDFTGDGRTDVLLYNAENGKWWLGSLGANNQLQLSLISNTSGFGNILSNEHRIWTTEDFTGDGRTDVLLNDAENGKWWLGSLGANNQLQWSLISLGANNQLQLSLISNTSGLGNVKEQSQSQEQNPTATIG
jgi:hypothetical protein